MKKHNNELYIDEDIALEKTNWKVQRVAWVLMFLFVSAVLLGFTGDGGLEGINHLTAGSKAEGLEVTYDRFLRRKAPTELQITLHAAGDSQPTLHFNKAFFEGFQVEHVVPEPQQVYTYPEGIAYTFAGKQAATPVIFYLKPKHVGKRELQLQAGGRSMHITQFVYP